MNKFVKKCLFIGGAAFVTGGILTVISIAQGGMSNALYVGQDGLQSLSLKREEHVVSDKELASFQDINIQVGDASISFQEADDFGLEMRYYTTEAWDYSFEYGVKDGVLTVKGSENNTASFHNGYYINYNDPGGKPNSLTIFLPKDTEFGTVQLDNRDCSITIPRLIADELHISSRYSSAKLENFRIGKTVFDLYDSDIQMTDFYTDTLSCENKYASIEWANTNTSLVQSAILNLYDVDMKIDNVNITNLEAENKYGVMEFKNMAVQDFNANFYDVDLSTNNAVFEAVEMENAYGTITATDWKSQSFQFSGNSCNLFLSGMLEGETSIQSNYGSINLQSSLPKNSYALMLSTSYGSITVDGEDMEESLIQLPQGSFSNAITVTGSSADISLAFTG